MKSLRILLPIVSAVALLSGCGTQQTLISPALVQQGVATGVAYSAEKYTNSIQYLRIADSVICSMASSTNIAPAEVIAAIERSPSAAVTKTPEGVLILNSALTLYTGIWNSYGSNAVANAVEIQPYLKATCDGINQGLPIDSGKMGVRRPSFVESDSWPVVKLP